MTELTFIGTAQEIAVGENVPFNVKDKSGCGERFASDTYELELSRVGRYLVIASANVAIPADGTANTPLRFALAKDGATVNETTMIVSPTALSAYNGITTATIINVRKPCGATIVFRNVGTIPTEITNQKLIAIKLA